MWSTIFFLLISGSPEVHAASKTRDIERLASLLSNAKYACSAEATLVKQKTRNVCLVQTACKLLGGEADSEEFIFPCSHFAADGCETVKVCITARLNDVARKKTEGIHPDLELAEAEEGPKEAADSKKEFEGAQCEYRTEGKKPQSLAFKKPDTKRAIVCATPIYCIKGGVEDSSKKVAVCEPTRFRKVAEKTYVPECPPINSCLSRPIDLKAIDVKLAQSEGAYPHARRTDEELVEGAGRRQKSLIPHEDELTQ